MPSCESWRCWAQRISVYKRWKAHTKSLKAQSCVNNHHTTCRLLKPSDNQTSFGFEFLQFPEVFRTEQNSKLKIFLCPACISRWNSLPPTWKRCFYSTTFAKDVRLSTLRILSIPMFVLLLLLLFSSWSYDFYLLIFFLFHDNCMELDH